MAHALRILAVLAAMLPGAALAQNAAISGVWRSEVEGTPSGMVPGVSSSDVQTLYLTEAGQYRREVLVEGGDGRSGVGGGVVDIGDYRFTRPDTFQYVRRNWLVCTFAGCGPAQPPAPMSGALPFRLTGQSQAVFLNLRWTKIQ